MTDDVSIAELRTKLGQIAGEEKAQDLVDRALTANQLAEKPAYAPEEICRICEYLKAEGGMIAVIASTVMLRAVTRS